MFVLPSLAYVAPLETNVTAPTSVPFKPVASPVKNSSKSWLKDAPLFIIVPPSLDAIKLKEATKVVSELEVVFANEPEESPLVSQKKSISESPAAGSTIVIPAKVIIPPLGH